MLKENSCKFNKSIAYYTFCIILLISIMPFISSAPPFTTTDTSSSGLAITPVQHDYLKKGADYDFNVHVFNQTTGMPVWATNIQCIIHLYNMTGDHLYSSTMSRDLPSEHGVMNEWVARIDGNNFTVFGIYKAVVQCNNSVQGGGIAGTFEVTPNGIGLNEGRSIIDIGLLFVFIIFFLVMIFLIFETENLLIKVFAIGFGYLILIAITFIAWNMANDFLLSAPFIARMFRILFWVLISGLFPLLLGGFVYYFLMLWKIKEIERMMEKGLPYDEAERRTNKKYK